jgi:hypothetical protein
VLNDGEWVLGLGFEEFQSRLIEEMNASSAAR